MIFEFCVLSSSTFSLVKPYFPLKFLSFKIATSVFFCMRMPRNLALPPFLPLGLTDLQLHLQAVLEVSEKDVGCAERGRSEPREQLLPLGGALSPHWR